LARLPAQDTTGEGSEATATTEMPHLCYNDMHKLTPCRVRGSRGYWFDGELWQCWNCVPPPSADMVRLDINQWNYLQPLFDSVMSRPDIPCYDFAEEICQVIQMMSESRVNVALNKLGAPGKTQAI
jgi:hypothetical protein